MSVNLFVEMYQALHKKVHQYQLERTIDSESQIQALKVQVEELSQKNVRINEILEVERIARSKAEMLVNTFETEKAELELELVKVESQYQSDNPYPRLPETKDDGQEALLTPTKTISADSGVALEIDGDAGTPALSQQVIDLSAVQHTNSALREALEHSMTEMRQRKRKLRFRNKMYARCLTMLNRCRQK